MKMKREEDTASNVVFHKAHQEIPEVPVQGVKANAAELCGNISTLKTIRRTIGITATSTYVCHV